MKHQPNSPLSVADNARGAPVRDGMPTSIEGDLRPTNSAPEATAIRSDGSHGDRKLSPFAPATAGSISVRERFPLLQAPRCDGTTLAIAPHRSAEKSNESRTNDESEGQRLPSRGFPERGGEDDVGCALRRDRGRRCASPANRISHRSRHQYGGLYARETPYRTQGRRRDVQQHRMLPARRRADRRDEPDVREARAPPSGGRARRY